MLRFATRLLISQRMDIDKTIRIILRKLGTGKDRIPMRRALRMCLPQLDELRERGLTWGQIAMRLTKAGARHKKGQAISEHQIRTEYNRLAKLRSTPVAANSIFAETAPDEMKGSSSVLKKIDPDHSPTPSGNRLQQLTATRRPRLELDD
jgi:hypothetical protein